ncbi:putative cytochrome P450 pisatin demethylase [Rhexocercosporidium sp. MPI-PUGE-AT-0058]|nr:putative cytochrome P450 pisatin demethylase [Rhexocercosporidium sp. MPI-PUGE-AT-0058]
MMGNMYMSIACYILFLAVLQRALYRRFFHALHVYPGPLLASCTNIWKLYHYLQGNLHIIEQNLHLQYGPIVRTGPNTLSFSTPEAFEAIYGFNHGFEKGDFYVSARDPATGTSNIFSARTHTEHRDRRRRIVGAAFSPSNIRSLSLIVAKHVQSLISQLSTASETAKNNTISIVDPIHAFTFNSMVEIIYGPSISSQPWTETPSGEGILPVFRAISKFSWGPSHVPFLGWLMSTPPMIKMIRKPTFNAAGIPNGVTALISRARHLLSTEPELVTGVDQQSIAKSMLTLGEGDSRYMELEDVQRECVNLLFAGPGSTAAAVTGVLERLGSKEGLIWQERLREELHQVKDVGESKVLTAVVRESMRYSAPFPTAFPREVRAGAERAIPGVKSPLPIGTIVGSNSWIVSHDKKVWGKDAEIWKPERWLEAHVNSDKKSLEDNFVVFSKGSRGCIGKDIALMIVTRSVASVVSRWRIETVGSMNGNAWLEMQIERCDLKFTKL